MSLHPKMPPSVRKLFDKRDGQWMQTRPTYFWFTCDCDQSAMCYLYRGREDEDVWYRECLNDSCNQFGPREIELTELDKQEIKDRKQIQAIIKHADEEGMAEIEQYLAVRAEMRKPATPYATMLDNITDEVIRKHIFLSRDEAIVLTLWVAHTWCLDAADMTPYIHLRSPIPRGGKSRVIEVMKMIVARPFSSESLTAAVIARVCNVNQISGIEPPTILMDEVDDIWKRRNELREIVNSGHKRGAFVHRASGRGGMRKMPIFSPKLMAGLKQLPDTVRDRSLQFEMLRATRTERPLPLSLSERRALGETTKQLRVRLQAFAENELPALFNAEPTLPEELDDRIQEAVEPLLAIADIAGGDWPEKSRTAFINIKALMAKSDNTQNDLKDLLANIREVFGPIRKAIYADVLVAKLTARDDWQWKSAKLTQNKLTRMLQEFREGPNAPPIMPRKMRLGRDVQARKPPKKAYERKQFEDAWARWLNNSGD